MKRIMDRLRWEYWMWFGCPCVWSLTNLDRQSKKIIIARWLANEPVEGRPKP